MIWMKRRIISLGLAFILLTGTVPAALAAGGSLDNFKQVNTYSEGLFSDVPVNAWYRDSVSSVYELGLMKGGSDSKFNVSGNLSVAETVAMASRLHCIYTTGTENFSQGSPWYQVYVNYAVANGIIQDGQYSDYTSAATRLQFATIFAAALPDEALTSINTIADGAIPDTTNADVYLLYRAGILTGSDASGTFNPGGTITRAEAAAIVARMADATLRKSITLGSSAAQKTELTSEEIYAKCSPAVFYIEVYDSKGTATASGSGFFILGDGTAVTNYHVINGAYSAKITVSNTGKAYNVLGVYDYSEAEDWAVLKIDGTGFSYLKIGDASTVVGGATVYAIGSPLGLQNTITQGLISNAARVESGVTYIQTSAAISSGSSGGALLNKYGEVIGITSASYTDGQNLNLALPIGIISGYSKQSTAALSSLAAASSSSSASISASQYSVELTKGDETTVTIYYDGPQDGYFYYTVEDKNVISCAWGDWADDYLSIPLTVSGLSEGSSCILIEIYAADSKTLLASTTIYVTVEAGVAYYSGYYPAVDYGNYTGTPLFVHNYYDGGTMYYYRFVDLPQDTTIMYDGYIALLEENGFSYIGSFDNDDGFAVLVFTNSTYGISVLFGLGYYGETGCMTVYVTRD